MRRATPQTKILNLIPQFSRELIGYTVLSACSNANLRASIHSLTEIELSAVNDLLNASFHVCVLTLLSVLSLIAAPLAARDSFSSACVEKWKLRSTGSLSKFDSILTSTSTRRRKADWWPGQSLKKGSSVGPKKLNLCFKKVLNSIPSGFFFKILDKLKMPGWK